MRPARYECEVTTARPTVAPKLPPELKSKIADYLDPVSIDNAVSSGFIHRSVLSVKQNTQLVRARVFGSREYLRTPVEDIKDMMKAPAPPKRTIRDREPR